MQIPKIKPFRLKGKAYKNLQLKVLDRDGFTCKICGIYTEAPPHHILPRGRGGSDVKENLITLCVDCHYKKHN